MHTENEVVKNEKEKPPMPAHDYAERWARDTLSGMADDSKLSWGERNIARCYLDKLNNTPKSPWIPVQEGLPKVRQLVAITARDGDKKSTVFAYRSPALVDIKPDLNIGGEWRNARTGTIIPNENVIAWMREPAPYEGEV